MATTVKPQDIRVLTAYGRKAMQELISQLRRDVEKTDEPRAQALFETTAEVLEGLAKAFADYDEGTELAFQR